MAAPDRYLKVALDHLRGIELDPHLETYHAAVIVFGGNIVSIGINKHKKNGFVTAYQHHSWCNTHAECDAILKARRKIDLTHSKLYVARLRRNGHAGNSKPCFMCQDVLRQYGIKRVYYTLDDNTYAVMRLT